MRGQDAPNDDLLAAGLAQASKCSAVLSEEGCWSFQELQHDIERVADDLRARNVSPGHRIAVMQLTGRSALANLLGSLRASGFVTLLSNALGPEARQRRLDAFRPDLVVDENRGPDEGSGVFVPPGPSADGSRLVLWTSGSTGLPRGVVLDWRGVLWNARANAAALGVGPADRALVLLDGAYCYALVHQILTHLVVGGSVAIPPQPTWLEATGRFIERFAPTTLAVVPSILRSLIASPSLCASLSRLRLITIGGAAIDEALLRRAQEALPGVQLVVTYGLTEAGPRVASRFYRAGEEALVGTVGRALPGVDLRVAEDGEIFVRSPSVRVGLLEEGAVRPVSPWLATGDLGELGADGVLRVLGRRRPMINRGGFKLSPGEIERVLSADPSVVAARVVVVPHSRLGEAPKALIVLRPDAAPEPLALARRCLDLLGAHWVPVAFEFLSALPPAGPSWKDAP